MDVDNYTALAYNTMRLTAPTSPIELWHYIKEWYGLEIPWVKVCPCHDAPFDYVVGSFFCTNEGWSEWEKKRYSIHDRCIVWANRGGGKTQDGGVVSHMDSIHWPGCSTRILGGSKDQSEKMYFYVNEADLTTFSDMVVGGLPSKTLTSYTTGSHIKILTQSQKSVRGEHPIRLKLDEIEEFKEDVHDAVKLSVISKHGIPAKIEQFSTWHKRTGPMSKAIKRARETGSRVYTWCLWETMQRCTLPCTKRCRHETCVNALSYDMDNRPHSFAEICGGKAKRSRGYTLLEDALRAFKETTYESFCAEMLCERPSVRDSIYPYLQRPQHMRLKAGWFDPDLPMILGGDGGFEHPFAVWIQIDLETDTLICVGEYAPENITASDFADEVTRRHVAAGYPLMLCGFNDPASRTWTEELNKPGRREKLFVKKQKCVPADNAIQEGYEAVRSKMKLFVDDQKNERPRLMFTGNCHTLYDQLEGLLSDRVSGELTGVQIKANDHGPDALRYAVLGWKQKKHLLLTEQSTFRVGTI